MPNSGPGDLESGFYPQQVRGPVKNLRITFWGTQGSVPIFPQLSGVYEYARRSAVDALYRAWKDLSERARSGLWDLDDLKASAPDLKRIDEYQKQLGLVSIPIYGGDTTCCEVETAEGDTILLDAGTAVRNAARAIVQRTQNQKNRTIHLLATHEHLDHRGGLPFAQFCYERDNPFTVNLYGTHGYLSTLDTHYGLFSHPEISPEKTPMIHSDDPVDYRMIAATFRGIELREDPHRDHATGRPYPPADQLPWEVGDVNWVIRIGRASVTAIDLYHGRIRSLAYRIDYNGKSFVFCTDHEFRHGSDPTDERQIRSAKAEKRVRELCDGVDVAYFDGQYLRREYDGQVGIGVSPKVPKMDWGHSCIEDCLDRARQCHIGQTYIGHHDPEREWPERLELDAMLSRWSAEHGHQVRLARAELVVDL
jgi:hypothetical protein